MGLCRVRVPLMLSSLSDSSWKGIEKDKCPFTVYIDLKKAYDRVPREEVWNCLRLKGVTESYVRLIQDMYRDSQTQIRCADGLDEPF